MNIKNLPLISACIASMFAVTANAQTTTTIVDDNFDGTVTDGQYYSTSGSNAIEGIPDGDQPLAIPAPFGLVSGGSGRQIHSIFDTQELASVGDTLNVTVTFTTPATVDDVGGESRIGLFDTLGQAGLSENISNGSSTPNPLLNNLPGFYTTIDVDGPTITNQDLDIRRHDVNQEPDATTGRLLGTSTGFPGLNTDVQDDSNDTGSTSGPDAGYVITANNQYSISFEVERVTTLDPTILNDILSITSTLTDVTAGAQLDTITRFDFFPASFSYGMIALGANGGTYGSSNVVDTPDNGITIDAVNVMFTDADGVDDGGGDDPVDPPVADETCYTLPTTSGGNAVFCL